MQWSRQNENEEKTLSLFVQHIADRIQIFQSGHMIAVRPGNSLKRVNENV